MITPTDLRTLARARLADAALLCQRGRYDSAVYMCGYAIEFSLKARICRTLKWPDYLSTGSYHSFRTHDLEILLHLSGIESRILGRYLDEWTSVQDWNPEMRYNVNTVGEAEASAMIDSARILVKVIYD
ncbi:MAG TPA: HEPN domain-containing protein [Armatimonadota bacterium]|nr:HEPN domain-containing protein [Armatimonadota bacterium]